MVDYSPWGSKESDTTESLTHIHILITDSHEMDQSKIERISVAGIKMPLWREALPNWFHIQLIWVREWVGKKQESKDCWISLLGRWGFLKCILNLIYYSWGDEEIEIRNEEETWLVALMAKVTVGWNSKETIFLRSTGVQYLVFSYL